MGKYLGIGNAGFTAIRKGTYIDKTGLISFVNKTLGTMQKLTCVSRPRRFGKSYAAKMLCAYYDKSCHSAHLFSGLEIANDPSYQKYLNKYDVIYLDITLFIASAGNIKDVVSDIEKKVTEEIQAAYPGTKPADTLLDMLFHVTEDTGNKFIIIIDEWDALFREAKQDTQLQEDYIRLLRGLFKSSLTDVVIEGAYMTGILPIKKYGTQSAMTDFFEYTMLQPEPLEKYVGFTEEEVRQLCEDSRLDFETVRDWYDGYILGDDVHIYSPKSVMDAISRGRLGNYWTQTETYESLRLYIDLDEDGLKESIVQMLGGARQKIDIATFQNDLTSPMGRDDVLTLLVHLGYLSYCTEDRTVFIPNEAIQKTELRSLEMEN